MTRFVGNYARGLVTETLRLQATCSNCFKRWWPFGRFTPMQIPHFQKIQCPKCGNIEEFTWHDSETRREIIQNNLANTNNPELQSNPSEQDKRVDNLENQIKILENKNETLEARSDADRKELQNMRQLIDLAIQNEIKNLKGKASDHDFNLNTLQSQITKLEELLTKIRNWQDNKDGR